MMSLTINDKLYQKMQEEQAEYRAWLLTLPANEVLIHAYDYVLRANILITMEYNDLPDEQAAALLQSKQPLKELFEMWRDRDGIPADAFLDAVQEYVSGKIGGLEEA
jgi:hypothetical protein